MFQSRKTQPINEGEVDFPLSLSDFRVGGYYGVSERPDRPTTFARLRRRPLRGGVDFNAQSGYFCGVGHELTDEVSLELGRRVAARLRQQPELLRIASDNLDRWTRLNAGVPSLLRCYAEWREILRRPLEEICGILSSNDEEARRLRQNSPFAGVLSAQEVWELKRRVHHATTST